jgi:hypothetical protein
MPLSSSRLEQQKHQIRIHQLLSLLNPKHLSCSLFVLSQAMSKAQTAIETAARFSRQAARVFEDSSCCTGDVEAAHVFVIV